MRGTVAWEVWVGEVPEEEDDEHEEDEREGANDGFDPLLQIHRRIHQLSHCARICDKLGPLLGQIRTRKNYLSPCPILGQTLTLVRGFVNNFLRVPIESWTTGKLRNNCGALKKHVTKPLTQVQKHYSPYYESGWF